MPFNFLIQFAIGLALMILSYALTPKPKAQKPGEVQDLEAPTAEAGREIPVVFGSITVSSANCLWYGKRNKREYGI